MKELATPRKMHPHFSSCDANSRKSIQSPAGTAKAFVTKAIASFIRAEDPAGARKQSDEAAYPALDKRPPPRRKSTELILSVIKL